MRIFAKSDIGLKRDSNQDCYDYEKIKEDILWSVVCDGMGGVNGGDVASALAVKSIREFLVKNFLPSIVQNEIENILKKSIEKANSEIFSKSQTETDLKGMGTTVVLVAVFKRKIYIAHVGDSRAYLLSNDKIKQLTIDHSMVQEMLDEGEITREEAKNHPNKNIITRALGLSNDVNIDYSVESKKVNDKIIICTDGLTNYLDCEEILECSKRKKGNDLLDELISIANKRGGSDNITVVLLSE